ncbi:methyltransferase domain-containing protein [Zavarzinia compransoris]|uniref:class I SAM-dependent methyltransferase n=1 Tax=Zavarzinia marina TaxID=2911065 RepID=UPI001F230AF7|nr:methyltransferase domain-containing protein [Zavarzinia marina]MCF4165237.1 methyltransferase domain-containing protein [Zavarzinia marina]
MGVYERHVVPHIINFACGMKPIRYQRGKVVPQAEGVVLEIGIGTGLNLPFYDAKKVTKLIGLDPSVKSWKIAGKRAEGLGFPVEFIGLPGERIPLDDHAVDTVVVTYSLCTIPDPVMALEGMRRVLKPGGKLLFCEHGEAPDHGVKKWQGRINPMWKPMFGGCNLHRRIPDLLQAAGFTVEKLESMYLPGTPRIAGYNYWGVATA